MTRGGGARDILEALFRAALSAVDAGDAVARNVRSDGDAVRIGPADLAPGGRITALAVGKAAAPMARALEEIVGDRITAGLAVTRDGYGSPLSRFVLREAGHPVPDSRSERAAHEALALVGGASPEDLLVVLLSGGASSLLSCPAPGLTQDDLAEATRLLLTGGAPIDALNAFRKHTSAVAGGRLAKVATARRVVVLAVSDVPGDRLDVIGSGPFEPDLSTFADALSALADAGAEETAPERVLAHLRAGLRGDIPETPKPGDRGCARVETRLIATNAAARAASRAAAGARGLAAVDLGEVLHGEARETGARLAGLGRSLLAERETVLIAGGETTVTVGGSGRGGRSQEAALAAALVLDGSGETAVLFAGSDGCDGPTDAAGAFADGGTLTRGRACGQDARDALERNDSYRFFDAEGGILRTGPTRTNVADLAFALRAPPSR